MKKWIEICITWLFPHKLSICTHPIVHGSEPDRTRGIWIVPNLWKLRSSMPSAVKQGISQRMLCEPLKSSAEPRIGALGVRRRFCFGRVPGALLSKIETKLGICVPLFHWSWASGRESRESGVALRDREPVLHVCIKSFQGYWWSRNFSQSYLTSTSRKTSRMSGFFLVFLDLVLPRTVRFSALTLNFTASAWCFDSRAKIGANSDVGCSRPWKKREINKVNDELSLANKSRDFYTTQPRRHRVLCWYENQLTPLDWQSFLFFSWIFSVWLLWFARARDRVKTQLNLCF